MVEVAIALGSNLDQPHAHLQHAVRRLGVVLGRFAVSSFIETLPEHGADQPRYLNGAARGDWPGDARALLRELQAIEQERGRRRVRQGDSRTLDLDLILFGDAIIHEPGLVVPHPRFRRRGFVLRPLAEVAPEMVDPVTGLCVRALYEQWKEAGRCA
ncbi:MAG: 2-amino-4-hydroxy-6-hydroxymethyldihydropteridine diphosphokinase [Acidobacteriota bacterium]